MHSNRCRNAVMTAFIAIVLASAGCTGTEVLITGQQTLTVDVQLVNSTNTRFESAYLLVNQIALWPLDEDAAAALRADGIGAIGNALRLDYAQVTSSGSSISLAEGVYQVVSVTIGAIAYTDLDGYGDPATCEQYVPSWQLFTPNPSRFIIDDFGEEVFVTVEGGGENTLTMVIDGAALEEAFLDSWSCNQTWSCVPTTLLWCPFRISADNFTAQASNFLDFQ